MKIQFAIFFFFFIFFSGNLLSQHKHKNNKDKEDYDSANVKNPYGIYFSLGPSFSGTDVYKNYLRNPQRWGYNARIYGEFSNTVRLVAGFTRITAFTYLPSWNRLSAFNLDLDFHIMARMKDNHSIFYAILGGCLHQWKGDFLTQSAYYDEIAYYKPNTTISHSWIGMNIGVGFERAFKYFEIFGEYRYRFSSNEFVFGISDVAINFGIKKKIVLRGKLGKIFRGINDKYKWF